jgi:hypothetical protein
MHCPTFEIRIAVPNVEPEKVLRDFAEFYHTVAIGREAADRWFETAEGQLFLVHARRTPHGQQRVNSYRRAGLKALPLGPLRYGVKVVSARLLSRKPSGDSWDGPEYGPADPQVVVRVLGEGVGTLRTPVAHDNLTPTWNHSELLQIARGDALEITLWDADAFDDDEIVSVTIPFDGPGRYVIQRPDMSLIELLIDIRFISQINRKNMTRSAENKLIK